MKYSISAAVTSLALLVGDPAPTHAGNIVVNGGFETGDFSYWNVNDPSFGTFVSSASPPYIPHTGDYFAALGASGLLGTLSQDVNTTSGQTYVLDYFLASDGNTPNEFKVVWNGATIFDQVNIPAQDYTEYTFLVTATGESTNLTFYERNDNGFLSLDDVSANVVPATAVAEPTSLTLFGIGIASAACCSSRRRATKLRTA